MKTGKELKWLMLTNYVHTNLLEGEECLRTGLYSWIPVFQGEVKWFKDVDPSEYKNYDIIHVNLSAQDAHIIGDVRKVIGWDSDTKIVVNNDYTLELWQGSFDYLSTLAREINQADMIFGTEPNQVGFLEVLLGRKVHLIVHPCFTKRLKTLRPKKSKDIISVISHRYDNYNILPSYAAEGHGFKIRLIGYDEKSDPRKYVTMTRYNDILPGTNYMDFCEQLMESKLVIDPFTLTSQSRTGWDCAALGVPLVTSDRTYSGQVCFPKTIVSPFDIKSMRKLVKRLLTDEAFRNEVIEYARNAVEMVSYENSKKKYLEALSEGSPKIQEEDVQ